MLLLRMEGTDERPFQSERGGPSWLALRVQLTQNNEEDGTGGCVNQYVQFSLLIINVPSDCLIHIFSLANLVF